ncbi:MAG: thioredoxin family protein [Caldilineaceae bacterium]|nr:thioredoxin family protein [Caldilineaceae bacterium]
MIPINEAIFVFTSGVTFREYLLDLDVEQRLFLERRYAAVRISPAIQNRLATYPLWLYWVLLVNNETPDTWMVLPIVQRLAELCPRIDLRILSDEADMAALNELVDDDINLEEDLAEIDMPHLFIFDEEWNQQAQWGPRPQAAEERLDQWLSAHPDYGPLLADDEGEDPERLEALITELTDQMRLWYNDDLTAACAAEIAALLEELLSEELE